MHKWEKKTQIFGILHIGPLQGQHEVRRWGSASESNMGVTAHTDACLLKNTVLKTDIILHDYNERNYIWTEVAFPNVCIWYQLHPRNRFTSQHSLFSPTHTCSLNTVRELISATRYEYLKRYVNLHPQNIKVIRRSSSESPEICDFSALWLSLYAQLLEQVLIWNGTHSDLQVRRKPRFVHSRYLSHLQMRNSQKRFVPFLESIGWAAERSSRAASSHLSFATSERTLVPLSKHIPEQISDQKTSERKELEAGGLTDCANKPELLGQPGRFSSWSPCH